MKRKKEYKVGDVFKYKSDHGDDCNGIVSTVGDGIVWLEDFPKNKGYNPYYIETGIEQLGYKNTAGNTCAKQTDTVQTFDTGAKRDNANDKPRPDLIPGGVMLRLGEHFAKGAEKYGERNFELGIPSSRTLASLCRHVEQFKDGDDKEDHLAAIAANTIFLMFNEDKFEFNRDILDLDRYDGWGI